jgi:hypothetical protein
MANDGFAGSSCAKAMEDKVFFDIGTNLVPGGVRKNLKFERRNSNDESGNACELPFSDFGGLKNTFMFA